jgi:CspA family cold shock protein
MSVKRENVYGTVDWFNNSKGFGFATANDDPNEKVFVHFSSIVGEGFKTLQDKQVILYDVHSSNKGLHAVRVRQPDE